MVTECADPYEVVPSLAFEHAGEVAAGLLRACAEPDIDFAVQLCAKLTRAHGVDGVFALAAVLAGTFAGLTGLDKVPGRLGPRDTAQVSVRMPDLVLFGSDGYEQRTLRARRFFEAYLRDEDTRAYAELRAASHDDRQTLLHGLCELVVAAMPRTPR